MCFPHMSEPLAVRWLASLLHFASMFIHRIIQTGSSYRGAWPWRA